MSNERDTLQRVQAALFHLRQGLAPFVETQMFDKHGPTWLSQASRAASNMNAERLDEYGLLKTMLDNWRDHFGTCFSDGDRHKMRAFASLALEARNVTSHATTPLTDAETLRYLDCIHELLKGVNAPANEISEVRALYDLQRNLDAAARSESENLGQSRENVELQPLTSRLRIRASNGTRTRLRARPAEGV